MGTALTLSTADRFTVRSAIAPLLGEARISAPLTSQLLAGDVLQLVDGRGDWLHIRGADDYEGWTHVGFLMPYTGTEATWRISLGCVTIDPVGQRHALPLGARVATGLEVIEGVCGAEAQALNRAFCHRIATGRPYAILKWAMSLDGRTALPNGVSQWISGPAAREWVQQLRARCDAVIVGGGTVRADDPLLTSRGRRSPEPLRVVFSRSLDLPPGAK